MSYNPLKCCFSFPSLHFISVPVVRFDMIYCTFLFGFCFNSCCLFQDRFLCFRIITGDIFFKRSIWEFFFPSLNLTCIFPFSSLMIMPFPNLICLTVSPTIYPLFVFNNHCDSHDSLLFLTCVIHDSSCISPSLIWVPSVL